MDDAMQSPTTAAGAAPSAETTVARSGALIPGRSLLAGWRHTAQWTYLIMLIASATALFASFVLSAETLQLARHPGESLGCDVNGVLSCSTVAQSWQAEIVKFGGLSYPNAFFGIAAESVFVTIAVIGLCQVRVPRWFAAYTWFGGLAALAYAYWLFSQSMFVIHALCPWCMVLMFSTTIQFMALSHATAVVQGLPPRGKRLRKYYRLNIDLMIDVVWVLAIVTLILVVDGPALFA
ncbi:vitamin K epoxide reductase family protein [Bifidobacterium pullorum]|uniref:vitamin K epoxide reductase family protein n=1 Tax=Bifidobacterium pullorum TaxID=78448 RepID=UPI002431E44F|nr:vitamin K epoxide reductase family protein [Bifidobacterium pullorum]